MILIDDGFWAEFWGSRMCAIEGKKGDGKTLLALDLSEVLLKKGYKLCSNMSCVWNDNDNLYVGDQIIYLVDEGGTYLRTGSSVNNFSRFLRKLDAFLIMPCAKLPHEDLCELTISPWWNFYKNLGIPLKLWRWDVNLGKKTYSGNLLQANWQAFYGVYSSIDPGDFPEKIMQVVTSQTKELFEQFEREMQLRDVALKSKNIGEIEQIESVRDMAKTASKLRESLSLAERETTGGRRTKKRLL